MEIDFSKQRLKIGIRDFVSFGQNSYPMTPIGNAGTWRTQLGQHWHQQLWQETQQFSGDKAQSEVSIKGNVHYEGWEFELSGRIDQVIIEQEARVLREIKTTQQVIPLPRDQLQQIYPDYFEQVACYQLLASKDKSYKDTAIISELLMLHVDTGIRQIITFDTDPLEILTQRFNTWVDFLQGQKQRDDRVRHVVVPAAFEHFRDDQLPVRELLLRQINRKETKTLRLIALQAATGFGKTSIAIEWALNGLQQGNFNRVVYVTGKNTGQNQVLQELNRFKAMAAGIRFFQVRNMNAHLEICPHIHCPCRERMDSDTQLESFIPYKATQELLKEGSPQAKDIGLHASNYHLCPRLISESCLSHTEFWIADYNYIFSSGAHGVVSSIPGFDPSKTLLIIDETHNLHDRVAANHSAKISSYTLERLLSILGEYKAPKRLHSCVDQIRRFCYRQSEQDRISITDEYELIDLLESYQKTLTESGAFLIKLPTEVNELLWELSDAYQVTQKKELTFLNWVPKQGLIRLSCIDASPSISDSILDYNKVLFMSATFPPKSEFEDQIGIKADNILSIDASSPWRNDAYSVAIDVRVNTSYKRRQQSYLLTSDTLAQLEQHTSLPVVAFFPSYKYATTLSEYLQVSHPHLRILTLDRDLTADEQIETIQHTALSYDILCLPLGSGLSEGIDVLGGMVDTIMIVSPSLPEVNAIQAAKAERFSNAKEAFRSNYLVPGLTKVNQALGRIVRKPEHHAKVLLHCERFSHPDYKSLLSEEYQDCKIVKTNQDLDSWLLE